MGSQPSKDHFTDLSNQIGPLDVPCKNPYACLYQNPGISHLLWSSGQILCMCQSRICFSVSGVFDKNKYMSLNVCVGVKWVCYKMSGGLCYWLSVGVVFELGLQIG